MVETTRKRPFRTYSYRGVPLDKLLDMDVRSLKDLFCARQRRRINRGLMRQPKRILSKLAKKKKEVHADAAKKKEGDDGAVALGKPAVVKTHLRNMIILPEMIGSMVGVYNGRVFYEIEIKPEMVGYYLGEFSLTYKTVRHGKPGIGATHSSRFIPLNFAWKAFLERVNNTVQTKLQKCNALMHWSFRTFALCAAFTSIVFAEDPDIGAAELEALMPPVHASPPEERRRMMPPLLHRAALRVGEKEQKSTPRRIRSPLEIIEEEIFKTISSVVIPPERKTEKPLAAPPATVSARDESEREAEEAAAVIAGAVQTALQAEAAESQESSQIYEAPSESMYTNVWPEIYESPNLNEYPKEAELVAENESVQSRTKDDRQKIKERPRRRDDINDAMIPSVVMETEVEDEIPSIALIPPGANMTSNTALVPLFPTAIALHKTKRKHRTSPNVTQPHSTSTIITSESLARGLDEFPLSYYPILSPNLTIVNSSAPYIAADGNAILDHIQWTLFDPITRTNNTVHATLRLGSNTTPELIPRNMSQVELTAKGAGVQRPSLSIITIGKHLPLDIPAISVGGIDNPLSLIAGPNATDPFDLLPLTVAAKFGTETFDRAKANRHLFSDRLKTPAHKFRTDGVLLTLQEIEGPFDSVRKVVNGSLDNGSVDDGALQFGPMAHSTFSHWLPRFARSGPVSGKLKVASQLMKAMGVDSGGGADKKGKKAFKDFAEKAVEHAVDKGAAELTAIHGTDEERDLLRTVTSIRLQKYWYIGRCVRNYSGMECPMDFTTESEGLCVPPKEYDGPCGPTMLGNSTAEEKEEFAWRCAAQWPCLSSPPRNYTKPCPRLWVNLGGALCIAPADYDGICSPATDFTGFTAADKAIWSAKCGADWLTVGLPHGGEGGELRNAVKYKTLSGPVSQDTGEIVIQISHS